MNYIVSGLERSGTSLMMQALHAGGIPIAFDNSRKPDYHNPKGYYELAGGKVIKKLIENNFPIADYQDKFIKITAYGLKFLPKGSYKILYMMRDIEEILDSTEKMIGKIDRGRDKILLDKLNKFSIDLMESRNDMRYITVEYPSLIKSSHEEMLKIKHFIGDGKLDINAAINAIEPSLYRNRRS